MSDSPLIMFSPVRWDAAPRRPHQLAIRFARERRVLYVEEPLWDHGPARLEVERHDHDGRPWLVTPHLPFGLDESDASVAQRLLLEGLLTHGLGEAVFFYSSPLAIAYTRHLRPRALVYDHMGAETTCHAPPTLVHLRENELLRVAHLCLAATREGARVLRPRHQRVDEVASGVDAAHFRRALRLTPPADQAALAGPCVGYAGPIDDRIDLALLALVASARPDLTFVMAGPLEGVAARDLPQRPNLCWLTGRSYAEWPAYMAGWDAALLPLRNGAATPSGVAEHAAAGLPVVTTAAGPLPEALAPAVRVARDAGAVAQALDAALAAPPIPRGWLDAWLDSVSWDACFERVRGLVELLACERAAGVSAAAVAG